MTGERMMSLSRGLLRTGVIGVVSAVLVWFGQIEAARAAEIEGYRSARFGMTEAEVLHAIEMDFGLDGGETRIVHPIQKTSALVIRADGLVSGAGVTQVVYIFGYRSKQLIQVTLSWGHPLETTTNAAILVGAARSMMNRMALQGLPANTLTSDMVVDDGSIIVYHAEDANARVIEMRMKGPGIGPAADGDGGAEDETSWLRVSFIQDTATPDIYRIQPGDF